MLSSDINELVKISLIGFPAVGKTTILKLLTENMIDRFYLPTQGFDLKTVKFGQFTIRVWDFGGQKSYLNYLEEYLKGSDLIFIITDSTPRNVINSRTLIDYSNNIIDNECPIIAIANKQDLCNSDGRLEQTKVKDILQVKTYGLTAVSSSERLKLMNIIEKELNQVLIRKRFKKNEI